jgi:hypothetical protein
VADDEHAITLATVQPNGPGRRLGRYGPLHDLPHHR